MRFQFLKLNQLRFVDALKRFGKLNRAADALHISQPAASRTLAEIEALIGQPICARSAHGVIFNELGEALAARARRIIGEMERLGRDLVEITDGRHGKVRIGAVTTAAVAYALPASLALRAISPRMQLQIDVEPSRTLMQRMRVGDYDFVLGRLTADDDPSHYDVRQIGEETVRLAVREEHPLADRRALTFAELSDYDWIMQPAGSPIWSAVSGSFQAEGAYFPDRVTYTASILLTLAAISRTDAISPIARDSLEMLHAPALAARLRSLDMARRTAVPGLSIITQRDSALSPIARKLLDSVILEIEAAAGRAGQL